jgi:hypothetical protein
MLSNERAFARTLLNALEEVVIIAATSTTSLLVGMVTEDLSAVCVGE